MAHDSFLSPRTHVHTCSPPMHRVSAPLLRHRAVVLQDHRTGALNEWLHGSPVELFHKTSELSTCYYIAIDSPFDSCADAGSAPCATPCVTPCITQGAITSQHGHHWGRSIVSKRCWLRGRFASAQGAAGPTRKQGGTIDPVHTKRLASSTAIPFSSARSLVL
jgi:hypothetical protein